MGIKINASRKTTIILLVVLFLIVGGSGVYLLWRVNQRDTVAPIDSEAGGGGSGQGGACCKCPSNGYSSSGCSDGETPSFNCTCAVGTWCPGLPHCGKQSGKQCTTPACVWPSVGWWFVDTGEGNCACAPRTTWDENPEFRCTDTMPSCTPPSCPEGYIDMHVPGGGTAFEPSNYSAEDLALIEAAKLFDHKTRIVCVANGSAELCFTECGQERCQPCDNPYWVRRMCKKALVNTCGDGVKAGSEQCDPPNSTCTTASGKQSICSETCTCPELPENPNWDIKKVSIQECINDGTGNPVSRVSNSITITNKNTTAGAVGKINSIMDTLDPKVIPSTITNISDNGVVAERASIGGPFIAQAVISWNLTSPLVEFNPGESKTFTYRYTIAKDAFGIYDNSVIATPSDDPNNVLRAATSIEARCNVLNPSCGDGKVDTSLGEQCDPPGGSCTDVYGKPNTCSNNCTCPGTAPVPETGLFDESENIVTLGAIILFLGLGWTWLNKTYEIVNGKLVQRNKERFERRVVKN